MQRLHWQLETSARTKETLRKGAGYAFLAMGLGSGVALGLLGKKDSPSLELESDRTFGLLFGGALALTGGILLLIEDPHEREWDTTRAAAETATTEGRLKAYEELLSRFRDEERGQRSVIGGLTTALGLISLGVGFASDDRDANTLILAGGLLTPLGLVTILRTGPYENMWDDYRRWSNSGTAVASEEIPLRVEPAFVLSRSGAAGLGLSLSF